ncbi:MAG TPA: diaminopimelate epimerase [Acidobacteriota bacterium]|nr:diaminopimelate epimerase [Acidobacteriota bacterium]
MIVKLHKLHCYGNDFLVAYRCQLEDDRYSALARSCCDRHTGIGADGLVFLKPADQEGRFDYRIFNQDGSEAELSGNGARCACALVHRNDWCSQDEIVLQTLCGDKTFSRLSQKDGRWRYRSSLGRPGFRPEQVPFKDTHATRIPERILRYPLDAGGEALQITALSMGNPQCQILVDCLPKGERFQRLGSALERHQVFPQRANVGFVQVIDEHKVRAKIWERGVGPTQSSGTGCSAAAVAAIVNGRCTSPVEVVTQSGSQKVEWSEGQEVVLTGESRYVAEIDFDWQT